MWIKDPTLFPDDKRKAEICDSDHGDDIFYTFGYPFYDGTYSRDAITFTDDEKECSRAWMTYITNFATTGRVSLTFFCFFIHTASCTVYDHTFASTLE